MASTSSEYYIESLICECEKILAGEYGDSEQQKIDELMEEMEGFRFPLMCTQSIQILRDRTPRGVRKVKGWLIANIATLTAQGGSTTVKAEANANAAVDVSVAMTQTIRMLDGCSASKEEIDALKAAVADLAAADKNEPEKVCEKAARVLDLAKKGVDTVKAAAPLVAAALSTLGA